MRDSIFTFRCCTIVIPPGEKSATVTRHEGGKAAKFHSSPAGPTARVQAQRWAMGLDPLTGAALPNESDTELDEANDG